MLMEASCVKEMVEMLLITNLRMLMEVVIKVNSSNGRGIRFLHTWVTDDEFQHLNPDDLYEQFMPLTCQGQVFPSQEEMM